MKGINQRLVQRRMRGAQTPVSNGIVNSPVTTWKRKSLLSLLGGRFFLYACVVPFSCQGPLGVSANLIVFFFFKFNLSLKNFLLFIYSFPTSLRSFCRWQRKMNFKDDNHPNHHDVAILMTKSVAFNISVFPFEFVSLFNILINRQHDRSIKDEETSLKEPIFISENPSFQKFRKSRGYCSWKKEKQSYGNSSKRINI